MNRFAAFLLTSAGNTCLIGSGMVFTAYSSAPLGVAGFLALCVLAGVLHGVRDYLNDRA